MIRIVMGKKQLSTHLKNLLLQSRHRQLAKVEHTMRFVLKMKVIILRFINNVN